MNLIARQALPLVIAGLFVAAFAFHMWGLLPAGNLLVHDEYLTLDRSNGFLAQNDWWSTYTYGVASFEKPPLQYWFSAHLLASGLDIEFATRAFSYVSAVLALVATGALARVLAPQFRFAVPSAVILLSASPLFLETATTALLDTGSILLFTTAITFFILALRNPLWWYATAIAIGLGSMQKAPIALAFAVLMIVLLALVGKRYGIHAKEMLTNKHFSRAAGLAVVLSFWWFALQMYRHGLDPLHTFSAQNLERFVPGDLKVNMWAAPLRDAPLIWVPGLIAALALPAVFRKAETLIPAAIVLCFIIFMTLAGGKTYSRYSLIIYPFIAVALAIVMAKLSRDTIIAPAVAILLAVTGGQFFLQAKANDTPLPYLEVLSLFRSELAPGDKIILCTWQKPRIPTGAMSFYGSDGRPVLRLASAAEMAGLTDGPYRGICTRGEYLELKAADDRVTVRHEIGDQVYWTFAP